METHRESSSGALPHPFQWSRREARTLPVSVVGELPGWLSGQLVRTAPAVFDPGPDGTGHWFDAHGLLYGFTLGRKPTFTQCLLSSAFGNPTQAGQMGSFGTRTRRPLWKRVLRPVADVTDNTNVNVVPWGGDWLALTETSKQHVIAADTLATRGTLTYADELPNSLNMLAHPHFEKKSAGLLSIATQFGPRSQAILYTQALGQTARHVEARIPFERVPYLHAFGRSPRFATVIDHPLRVNPLRMLFSNKSFAEHFVWDPARSTRLLLVDRKSGEVRNYDTESLFCFHTVHQFEDGEDVVLDFLAYPNAEIVQALSVAALKTGLPDLRARLVRARLRPHQKSVQLETLCAEAFEFPSIDSSRCADSAHSLVWGAALNPAGQGMASEVLRVDLARGGEVTRFSVPGVVYGEPVFVADPASAREGDGVLLVVGSKAGQAHSVLTVLDAQTLAVRAEISVPVSLPLGFHGNFARARPLS